MPILELLAELEEDLDPNLPDNDGNTPLIFAAQAGNEKAESVFTVIHSTEPGDAPERINSVD